MTTWRVIREESFANATDSVLALAHLHVYTLEHETTRTQRQLKIRTVDASAVTGPHFRKPLQQALALPLPPLEIVIDGGLPR